MYQQTIERLIGKVFRLKFHSDSLGAWSFFGLSALFLFFTIDSEVWLLREREMCANGDTAQG